MANQKKKPSFSMPKGVVAVLCIAALVVGWLVQYKLFPNGISVTAGSTGEASVAEIDAASDIRMNEIMSKNTSAKMNSDGAYPDWIEIVNASNQPVDLAGWTIAESANAVRYFEFPSHILGGGETVMVYCTNKEQNTYGYEYQAPFKLSAAGEKLYLFNASGSAVQTLNVPALEANQVYCFANGEWMISNEYTPGAANTHENYQAALSARTFADSPMEITELMAKNVSYAPDENGEHVDWIELHNTSGSSVSLNGWTISDDDTNPMKWRIPDVTVEAGGYLLIYASGYDRSDPAGKLHTNFKLSTEKECVVLANPMGQIVDMTEYDLLKADQSYSKTTSGSWVTSLAPTPGLANTSESAALIDSQFAAQNTIGVSINEVMASTNKKGKGNPDGADWIELYNGTSSTVDLSGIGLSDDASKPRKWQFPSGASIESGEYMVVLLTGNTLNKKNSDGYFEANFKLSAGESETLVLADGTGKILDRAYLGEQYTNISYGRIPGQYGFFYLDSSTNGRANVNSGYAGRSAAPEISVKGGLLKSGDILSVEISAPAGGDIYYTTDATTPTTASARYDGPITITGTTILRACVIEDGKMPSFTETESYLYDLSHTVRIVSLVSDPDNLFSDEKGICAKGPNATKEYPYGSMNHGANFWMDWEREGSVEVWDTDGSKMLSQACGIKLHGQYSRAENQKAFKIFARKQYSGQDTFDAKLFTRRDYTSYDSFLLRASGQDSGMARMRDSMLSSLAADCGTDVMYQEYEHCVVYINGEYWGHYYMRERVSAKSVSQFENWTDPDKVDLVKANTGVKQGTDDLPDLLKWIKKNGVKSEENLKYVSDRVDVENYLHYIALEMFTGNTDTLNVKRYRNKTEGDGKWHWVLFDLDWAFYTDTNSFKRWLNPEGMGNGMRTDNTLFVYLMKNTEIRNRFFEILNGMMADECSTAKMLERIDKWEAALSPEMDMHFERWNQGWKNHNTHLKKIKTYAEERPGKILNWIKEYYGWSNAELKEYFAESMAAVEDYKKTKSK